MLLWMCCVAKRRLAAAFDGPRSAWAMFDVGSTRCSVMGTGSVAPPFSSCHTYACAMWLRHRYIRLPEDPGAAAAVASLALALGAQELRKPTFYASLFPGPPSYAPGVRDALARQRA